MAMVDRYKKSGGFIQLLQVMETCGPKKKEQFLKIINEETPKWAEALNQKMLSFEKILSWKPEAVLEVVANINTLTLATALKSLSVEEYKEFSKKLSPIESRKIDMQMADIKPDQNQISSCVMKVVSETRGLFISGALKYDKIDSNLVIPEEYELKIENLGSAAAADAVVTSVAEAKSSGAPVGLPADTESLRRKVVELTQLVNALRKENVVMKDKLDKIKKIA